jgi:cell division protease FtsH
MVTRWGFSDKLGPQVYGEESGQPFMGYASPGAKVSNEVAHQIDEEIRSVIDRNYQKAEQILQEHLEILHKMAEALMKWETIDKYQIDDLMAGKDPRPPLDEIDGGAKSPGTPLDKPDDKTVTTQKPVRQV